MKENILYIFGAGFSAPLGIPTMGDFIIRAKDIYASDSEKFAHFESVFRMLDELSKTKNFFHSDLFNIEEALSILEMSQTLGGAGQAELIIRFICNVIEFSTPEISPISNNVPGNWAQCLFGSQDRWKSYLIFVANLVQGRIHLRADSEARYLEWQPFKSTEIRYSAITFNYDLVIENCLKFIKNSFKNGDNLSEADPNNCFRYVKLHGSTNEGNIIPPTWNKSIHPRIVDEWRLAFDLIKEAQHIRILGYSFPVSDSYARYLFKAALLNSRHLKSIDVVTLDSDGQTEARYRDLFCFKYLRFKRLSIQDYHRAILDQHQRITGNSLAASSYTFNQLEDAHDLVMR